MKKDHTKSSIKQLSFIKSCFNRLVSCLLPVKGDYSLVIQRHRTAEVRLSIGRGLNNEGESYASLRIPIFSNGTTSVRKNEVIEQNYKPFNAHIPLYAMIN